MNFAKTIVISVPMEIRSTFSISRYRESMLTCLNNELDSSNSPEISSGRRYFEKEEKRMKAVRRTRPTGCERYSSSINRF